jgi:polar amino acid transport system substrate-binding protein
MTAPVSPEIVRQLAPTGTLRVGINLSNFLLVTGKTASGDPVGVAPDMGAEVARRLGVPVKYITYQTPGELADMAASNTWDIGLIGAEPQRAAKIAFSPAYCEIEATYLVPQGSPLKTLADVDKAGVRIAVTARAAYGLWLERNIKQATLVGTDTLDSATDKFIADKLEALAGLKPKLLTDLARIPGGTILDGHFMTVQQPETVCRRCKVLRPGGQPDRQAQSYRPVRSTLKSGKPCVREPFFAPCVVSGNCNR